MKNMRKNKKVLGKEGKNVGIYIRVSTDEQRKNGFSPEGQIETCRRQILNKDLNEIGIYEDLGVSGTTPYQEREGFSKLLYDIQIGKIDVVVFQMFDRLARSNTIAYSMIDIFENYSVRLIECQHDCDSGIQTMTMMKIFKSSFEDFSGFNKP